MKVSKEVMTKKPITIKANDSLKLAYSVMHKHDIRHLPVVDEKNAVVGILSDRDIQRAMRVKQLTKFNQEIEIDPTIVVEDFMSWPVYVVSETTSIKMVATQMLDQKISAYLVEDNAGKLKGIITTDDILKIFLGKEEETTAKLAMKAISHYFIDPEIS